MEIVDLKNVRYSDRNGSYGGAAGDKDGIFYNNQLWILKYPKSNVHMIKNDKLSTISQTPLSEYIGSHIYGILGYPVHETILGIKDDVLVVACKDFCDEDTRLLEMRTLKNIHLAEMINDFEVDLHETNDDHLINLNELFVHFDHNPEISKVKGVAERFWDQVVIDGLIGNNDRNNGNWGILASKDKRELAPIFDNGACFYPKKSSTAIKKMLQLPELEQSRNNSNVQMPFTLDNEHHLNYISILKLDSDKISNLQAKLLKESIKKNTALVKNHLDEIIDFINSIPSSFNNVEIISDARREYYLKSFLTRFESVLYVRYEELLNE